MPSCSIIIVTYNGWDLLQECLHALESETRPGVDVTIVDNGSAGDFVDRARKNFPWIQLIEAGRNLGFAAGNNLGIRQSSSDYVLLLNSDVIVHPGFVDAVLQPFADKPRLASVAAVMVFRTNPHLIASAGIEVYTNGLAMDHGLGRPVESIAGQVPVFGSSAGATAYRRTSLEDVGLFPESFFMYLEDVDLAWRLRLRGWESLVTSQAVAEHAYSASSVEGSSFKRKLLARNRIWYMSRCLPSWMLRRHLWRILSYDLMVMVSAPARRDVASLSGRLNAAHDIRQRLRERSGIQSRATVGRLEIERWLKPSPSPTRMIQLREETRMAAVSPSISDAE